MLVLDITLDFILDFSSSYVLRLIKLQWKCYSWHIRFKSY